MAFPNLSFYTPADIEQLKTDVIAERLRRVRGESITQGNKNGRGYSIQLMSDSELSNLENELARRLGTTGIKKTRKNFRGC